MKKFPETLNFSNKHNFISYNRERILSIFRQEIYGHILSQNDENQYFDLDCFSRKYLDNNSDEMQELCNIIAKELNELGWKTNLSFGDTGLFIYSTDEKPTSCW